MDIRETLMNLDALDDDMWTADGAPKIAAVASALNRVVLRKEIVDAAPGFTRENMKIDGYPGDVEVALPTPVEPPLITNLQDEQTELEANVKRMDEELTKAKAQKDLWIKRIDAIQDELIVLDPPLTNAQRARNFIEASHEARLKRHGVAALIIANLPKDVRSVGTPLDNAFARRNKRGLARPTR